MATISRYGNSDLQLGDLTGKQREVLAHIADNRTSKEIAAYLGVTESAVNQRIESIRSRLGGVPRAELARLYRQLVQDDPTCKPVTAENFLLPDNPLELSKLPANQGSSPWFADEGQLEHANLLVREQVSIVPAVLDGDQASLNRLVAIVGIAIGLLAVAMVCLGVAQALNTLV